MLRQGDVSALIISLDVLFVGRRLEAALKRRLESAGMSDCLVLASASHTHFAPGVDADKPLLGECDEQFYGEVEQKVLGLVDRVIDQAAIPVEIRYVAGTAEHSVNRRRRIWTLGGGLPRRTVAMRANPRGPADQSLHAVRLEDGSGAPLAFIWSYACHPVSSPQALHVTAEFPGAARRELRRRFGADLPVLFLQGFSGNLRPPAFLKPGRNPARRLDQLLRGPAFGSFSDAEYARWSGSLARLVADLADSPALRTFPPALNHQTLTFPLSTLIEGEPGSQVFALTRLRLATRLQLLTLTAEVVTEYIRHIARLFPEVETIPVGCVGGTYGYLPTNRMVQEGGYEAGGFFEFFSLGGRFEPSLETRVVAAMHGLSTAAVDTDDE